MPDPRPSREEHEIPWSEVEQFVAEVRKRYATDEAVFGGIALESVAYYALLKMRSLAYDAAQRQRERDAAIARNYMCDCSDQLCCHWGHAIEKLILAHDAMPRTETG